MKFSNVVIAATLVLTGCDQASETISKSIYQVSASGISPSAYIVISPGFRINDHGDLGMVYGYSRCPEHLNSTTKESGCTIIHSQDTTVPVIVGYGNAPHARTTKELWSIERQGEFPKETVRLKRPDNSYVMPFENH